MKDVLGLRDMANELADGIIQIRDRDSSERQGLHSGPDGDRENDACGGADSADEALSDHRPETPVRTDQSGADSARSEGPGAAGMVTQRQRGMDTLPAGAQV